MPYSTNGEQTWIYSMESYFFFCDKYFCNIFYFLFLKCFSSYWKCTVYSCISRCLQWVCRRVFDVIWLYMSIEQLFASQHLPRLLLGDTRIIKWTDVFENQVISRSLYVGGETFELFGCFFFFFYIFKYQIDTISLFQNHYWDDVNDFDETISDYSFQHTSAVIICVFRNKNQLIYYWKIEGKSYLIKYNIT